MLKVQLKRPGKARENNSNVVELLLDGKYPAVINKIEETNDEWNSLRVHLTFENVAPPADRRFLVFPASEALRSLVDIAGGDAEAERGELDPETLEGTPVYVYLGQRTTKRGQTFNTIKRFAAYPTTKGRRKPSPPPF